MKLLSFEEMRDKWMDMSCDDWDHFPTAHVRALYDFYVAANAPEPVSEDLYNDFLNHISKAAAKCAELVGVP